MKPIKKVDLILFGITLIYILSFPFPIYKPLLTTLAYISILAFYVIMDSFFISILQFVVVSGRLIEGLVHFPKINVLESQFTFILCGSFFAIVLIIATIDKYRKYQQLR
ncbi:hypothetical protein L0B53_01965 [Vibrio sp. SS-MA-C1-2]|uniref:hypothetical protein n=1 Tax=Vibrio sp. SS-MA-C1-2 TaxID=2908646 RepID=UPI001F3CDFD4|nr:hypothetical protein [Vibrio sp. SS-MA-C1-2]UJF17560.1 hypothetical protein L0B53_01965 [Vibrio sp. SS-MA-C1-2]